jgi:hypothetical protein
MVTFSDSMTLLFCLFVALFAFAKPGGQAYDQFIQAAGAGLNKQSMFQSPPGQGFFVSIETIVATSGMDMEGALESPMFKDLAIGGLRYYPDLDLKAVSEVPGSMLIRMPLDVLLDEKDALTPRGLEDLNAVVSLLDIKLCRVVIRSNPAGPLSDQERDSKAIKQAMVIQEYLSRQFSTGQEHVGFRVSNDVQLGKDPLPPGKCELSLLED